MLKFSIQLLKLFLFWIFIFAFQRLIFLLLNIHELENTNLSTTLLSFVNGLPLDISTASALLSLPFLLYLCAYISKNTFPLKVIDFLNYTFIIGVFLIFLADISLFKNWNTKINYTAISYLKYPTEIINSGISRTLLLCNLIFIASIVLCFYIYNKKLKTIENNEIGIKILTASFLLFGILIFIGIRGGINKLPIKKRIAYYCSNLVANNASLNSTWNFINIITKPIREENPYKFYNEGEIKKKLAAYYDKQILEPHKRILKSSQPNIIFLFCESFSADIIQSLGGEKLVTPCFEKLREEGILFSNFYASGNRTDQGLIASLSGFPAQPQTRIIEESIKYEKLPNIIKDLTKNKYKAIWLIGGSPIFANSVNYLSNAGVTHIVDEFNFKNEKRTQWGVYDEYLFSYAHKELNKIKKPFVAIIQTITSHEDFDAEVPKLFHGNNADYRNTVHYTDSCINTFIQSIKKENWYSNTLIILLSDHGHKLPLERNIYEKRMHQIPMIIFGGALKDEFKNTINNTISSQVDLPFSLSNQLDIKNNSYKWSHDLFSQQINPMAFYCFDNGVGIISNDGSLSYDYTQNKVVESDSILSNSKKEQLTSKCKALLQKVFNEYINTGK